MRPGAAPADAPRGPTERDELAESWTRLTQHFGLVLKSLRRSWIAERAALRLRATEFVFRASAGACIFLIAVALGVAGALFVVGSLRRGLETWTNSAWWSDLVLGVAMLGSIGLGAWLALRRVRRRTLRNVRLQLGLELPEPAGAGVDGAPPAPPAGAALRAARLGQE